MTAAATVERPMKRERAPHREFRTLRPVATIGQGKETVAGAIVYAVSSIKHGGKCKAVVVLTPLGCIAVLREDSQTAVNILRYHPSLLVGIYAQLDRTQAWEDVTEKWKEHQDV